jgi:threonine synthase
MHRLDQLRAAGNHLPWAVVATAHPAKFESVVEPLIGHPVRLPDVLARMLEQPATSKALPAEDHALWTWLLR